MSRAVDLATVELCLRIRLPRMSVGNTGEIVHPCTVRCVLLSVALRPGELRTIPELADEIDSCESVVWKSIKLLRARGILISGDKLWVQEGGRRGQRLRVDRSKLEEFAGAGRRKAAG